MLKRTARFLFPTVVVFSATTLYLHALTALTRWEEGALIASVDTGNLPTQATVPPQIRSRREGTEKAGRAPRKEQGGARGVTAGEKAPRPGGSAPQEQKRPGAVEKEQGGTQGNAAEETTASPERAVSEKKNTLGAPKKEQGGTRGNAAGEKAASPESPVSAGQKTSSAPKKERGGTPGNVAGEKATSPESAVLAGQKTSSAPKKQLSQEEPPKDGGDAGREGAVPLEFVHIPKVAGASVELAGFRAGLTWGRCKFTHKEGGRSYCHYVRPQSAAGTWTLNNATAWACRLPTSPWHCPPRAFRSRRDPYRASGGPAVRLFTVVRDPYARLLSEFYWQRELEKKDDETQGPDDTPAVLNRWVQKTVAQIKNTGTCQLGHCYPMHRYVYDGDLRVIDHVLRLENLEVEFEALMRRYNLSVPLLYVNKRNHTSSLTAKDLSGKSIQLINAQFGRDFELFGYKKMEHTKRRYVVLDLFGGLTNQAMEVWTALFIAKQLNRTLVLPQVRVKVPVRGVFGPQSLLEPFDQFWDEGQFVRCATIHANVSDIDRDLYRAHSHVDVEAKHTYKNPKKGPFPDLIARLRNDNAPYVKLVHPYNWQKLPAGCFAPSRRLAATIARHHAALPDDYACVHARTEADWYSLKCCQAATQDTSSPNPEDWTCGTPVKDGCYRTPRQIAQTLADAGLPPGAALWVASGSGEEALRPLAERFRVHTAERPADAADFFDYSIAVVDEAVCGGASRFWGKTGSTFSGQVAQAVMRQGGNASTYD